MENVENKRSSSFHAAFAVLILLLFFVSCKSNSYLDLLTGGSIRYWQYIEYKDSYMSFDKRTHRIFRNGANLKVYYLGPLELMSKGRHFKISGNRVTTYWKVHGYKIPVDTFDILEVNDQKLVLKWTNGSPVTLVKYTNE